KPGNLFHKGAARGLLHIMGKHKGEAMGIGPEVQVRNLAQTSLAQRLCQILIVKARVAIFDRPAQRELLFLHLAIALAENDAQRPGQEWLHLIVQTLLPAELPAPGAKDRFAKHRRRAARVVGLRQERSGCPACSVPLLWRDGRLKEQLPKGIGCVCSVESSHALWMGGGCHCALLEKFRQAVLCLSARYTKSTGAVLWRGVKSGGGSMFFGGA